MKIFGKELTFNGKKVYHAGDKPTPAEIGAASSTHNHQASQVTFTDGKTFQQKLDDGSLKGPKGDTGATGAKGATGATGAQGPAGVTPTIKAGTVTTGNAGTNAAVTASTSGTTTTFNFTIPKGANGATGATGPQGPKGDTGAQGPQGVKGDTGAKGNTGTSMRFKGAWSSTTAYVADANYIDIVTSGGNTYRCKSSHTNQAVTNTTYWELIAQKGANGATGAQGPKGDKGDTGATGPAGAKGADGLTTSVTVGSTKYTHSNGNITIPAYPTTLKNPNALTLQFNGTTNKTYDGSSAQTLNITPAAIGAAASSHGKHVPDTCTTITDWNSATTTGWYMGNNATNSPTANTWYFGEVITHNTNYVVQEVYQFTASTDAKAIPKYIRAKMNGTWGAWTNVTVAKAVPSNAVFTDTNTWRGVQDNLTSTATDQSLSANQGKVLKGLIDGKAASNHTHSYVPLANGGNITIHADSDSSSTGEYALIKAGHNELKIASSAGGTTVTKGQDKLTFNGNVVYHAGRKPSLSELGAAASNHTHNYAGSSSAGGAANSAVKLATARTISLGGILSGSASFDGSGNVTITAAANDITSITKSLKVTTGWMDTGIAGANLPSHGSYVVQMFINDGTNTGLYNEYFTGIMSWFKDATNSTDSDEILLHKAGHASNGRMVYLRTIRQGSNGTLKLQIAASTAFSAATNIVFKFKKLI